MSGVSGYSPAWWVAAALLLSACAPGTALVPVNVCVFAVCEQQSETGGGDQEEGPQEAELDLPL